MEADLDLPTPGDDLPFLRDGGEMGERMRRHDWSRSSLGDPRAWPSPLRTATSMMLNTLQPMFIAWGPDLAFSYNDAYAPILGARHPEALGRRFRDVWTEVWDDLEPLVRRALSGKPVWQEDLPLRMHRNGDAERAYFTFTYSPLRAEDGEVAGMFCTSIETTGRVVAERRLRETAAALAESRESYRRQGERLFALFEEAPGFVAALEGPDHVFTLVNAAYRQLIGHRDVVGLPIREAFPELAEAGFFKLLDRAYVTGEPYVGVAVAAPVQRTPGAAPERRYVDFIYQPVRDEFGAVTGILVQGSDVTDRELFLEKQQLLLNELNHRVKNNLATVQSLAAQTARRAPDLPTFIRHFEGRLVALARTHDILTQNAWSGADLELLMQHELSSFADQVHLAGPQVELNATRALAIGLMVHELATNAAKYGALSAPDGRVDIGWSVEGEGERRRLVFEWRETGGPPVQVPSSRGFGSRLVQQLVVGDLEGTAEPDFAPEGFRLRLTAPLPPDTGQAGPIRGL